MTAKAKADAFRGETPAFIRGGTVKKNFTIDGAPRQAEIPRLHPYARRALQNLKFNLLAGPCTRETSESVDMIDALLDRFGRGAA